MTEYYWPDGHKSLIAGFSARLQGVRVGRAIPADLETLPGYVRVIQAPGGRVTNRTQTALFDVEIFAPTWAEAVALTERVRAAGEDLHAVQVGGILIDSAIWAPIPAPVDYKNPAVQRFIGGLLVSYRKQKVR